MAKDNALQTWPLRTISVKTLVGLSPTVMLTHVGLVALTLRQWQQELYGSSRRLATAI